MVGRVICKEIIMKAVKYVIWGAGEYGKRAFNAVGKEHVEAFMDKIGRAHV